MSRLVSIGDIAVIKDQTQKTWIILGSCISVIFYVPGTGALMCHAQIPLKTYDSGKCRASCAQPCTADIPDIMSSKYVACAVQYMIAYLKKKRVPLHLVQTTLLGGTGVYAKNEKGPTIGKQNVDQAKKVLASHGLTIDREFTGGEKGITVWYFFGENKVVIRRHKEDITFELGNVRISSFNE
jgi:chemotaxis receptor (MCP) glutamine deamidase CheD